MRILLIGERLTHRSFNGANKAMAVLGSALHNAGFTEVVNLDLERPDVTMQDVCRQALDADLISFAGCLTPQWPELDEHGRQLYEYLRREGRADVPILVGGYATKNAEDIARASPWLTALFDGEGEEAIVKIARSVAGGVFADEMGSLRGLCFVDRDGNYRASTAERVKSLEAYDQHFGFVHVPSVHDMDIFKAPDGTQLKTAQIYTQRGCPWACSFCNKSTESNNVARLSPEAFRSQLRALKREGYQAVYLDVDTFTVNERSARQEGQILMEEGFVWGTNTRIDKIDSELMNYFVSTNCVYMFFGVEHIVPEVLLAIDKFNGSTQSQLRQTMTYPDTVRRVFKDMDAAGLPSSYFLILGLPKARLNDRSEIVGYEPSTFEDDMRAVTFGLSHCEPDFLNFNMLRFMPGSAAADAPAHRAYTCVRPSGERPITAGYFLPRVARLNNYNVQANHGVYRLCESVGTNQPTSTAIDAERVYDTISETIKLINARIRAGKKPSTLFIDQEVLRASLVTRAEDGQYRIAPLAEFERL